MDTSKVTQQVVLKVDRMTVPSWTVQVRDMLKGRGMYTVQCRGKGEISVELRPTVGGSSGGSGICGTGGDLLFYSFDAQAPPDGTMDVIVTAPRGAQWALLVTQPAGS